MKKDSDLALVLGLIKRNSKGTTAATLVNETGFDQKRIKNIVNQLKRKGKITCFLHGIYTKA